MGKLKGQLVFQHLEKISRKLLEDYPELVKEVAKGQNGIYALYRGDKLYYVGLAKNLRSRLTTHLKDRHGKTWDRFSIYLTLSDKHLKELESLVLRIASPKGNVIAGKFIKSENLLKTVRRRIREVQRKERFDIIGKDIEEKKQEPISLMKVQKDMGIMAPFVTKRIHIRFKYKGEFFIAHIRKDGLITFDSRSAGSKALKSKRYKSPSGIASAIAGHPMSGWRCWKYKNEEGEWVPLTNLRKKKVRKRFSKKSKDFDTIVVPANEEGFKEVFLGENCWYAIRISNSMIWKIRYIAAYQTAPISAITYYAEVAKIERYKDTGKYIVYFKDKAKRIKPINLSIKKKGAAPQAPRYTTFKKLQKAKKLKDVF
jgi:hypothetical protein